VQLELEATDDAEVSAAPHRQSQIVLTAKRMAAAMSAVVVQRAMTAGRRLVPATTRH
jgi:hypothetical protein